MSITMTSGPTRAGVLGRYGEPLAGRIFSADFQSEKYLIGDHMAPFADLFGYVRPEVVTVFEPVSNSLVPVLADTPFFFDPRGRRGLNISSVQGSLFAGITGGVAGQSRNTYTQSRNNTDCILEVFGKPGAELKVSGDVAATHAGGDMTGGRFRHIYLTLRASATRNVIVDYNAEVVGWKLSINAHEEFGGITFNGGSGSVPVVTLTPDVLTRINQETRWSLRGILRIMGHRGGLPYWGRSLSILDADGNGIALMVDKGVWRVQSIQQVAAGGNPVKTYDIPLTRYDLAAGIAPDLDFVIAVDKPAAKFTVEAADRTIRNIPLPVMGPINAITVGRHGTNSPKMMMPWWGAFKTAS